jgi:hypothetical protein
MKNKMKHSILSFLIIFSFSGCLDMNPISEIGESSFYKNQDDVYQAVIACYNGLQKPMNSEWYLTELRTDNSRLYGSGSTSITSRNVNAMDMFRIETSHPVNTSYWDDTYHNIANCNTVLKHLNAVEDENLRLIFEAEARFIRAYHYFNLVRLYGPVFLVTERISGDEAKLKERSAIKDVYTLIVDDLTFSATNLPVQINDANKGRVDQWAAITLLAKVHLTLGNLIEARELLLEVENTSVSGYELLTDYSSVFSINNEMNKEIIFAVRYKAGNIGLGSSFANDFAPANSFAIIVNGGGLGHNCPTQDLVSAFDSQKDKRKEVCLTEDWLDDSNKKVFVPYVGKYLSEVAVKNDGENDWPVLRYADVLLMLAEVENELSGPSAGLPRLNQVRTRAGLNPLELSNVSDKNKFRIALFNERRLEFAFENHRFFDLLRSEQLISTMKKHFDTEVEPSRSNGSTTSFYKDPSKGSYLPDTTLEEWQLLLPVPLNIMTVSSHATQNFGY